MRKYPVSLALTELQAESLLQLAGEAALDTFQTEDGISARRRIDAGEMAMERLVSAIGKARRTRNCI